MSSDDLFILGQGMNFFRQFTITKKSIFLPVERLSCLHIQCLLIWMEYAEIFFGKTNVSKYENFSYRVKIRGLEAFLMLILCEKDWFPTKTIHQLSIKEEKMLLLTVKIGKAKKDRNFFSLHDRWNSRHFFKLTLLVRGQNSRMLIKFLRSESGNPTISFPEPALPLSQDKANVGPGTRLATRRTKSLLLNHLLSRVFLMFILYHFEPALKVCFVLRTEFYTLRAELLLSLFSLPYVS